MTSRFRANLWLFFRVLFFSSFKRGQRSKHLNALHRLDGTEIDDAVDRSKSSPDDDWYRTDLTLLP